MTRSIFEIEELSGLSTALGQEIERAYAIATPMAATLTKLPDITAKGVSLTGLPQLWRQIVDQSAHLASPWMSGHMDTAPHPAAALTQALVAALNNNLLFRELSPLASAVEEHIITFFIDNLELGSDWHGVFASGGSISNLTALFAAVGGFAPKLDRDRFHLILPASGHVSLVKAAGVLGLQKQNVHHVACDNAGRIDLTALETCLASIPSNDRPIVTSVLGTTIHGSVDDIAGIDQLCKKFGAWHHVDAIYGTALAFSKDYRHFLAGLSEADSIVLGPQKWLYVPRVSAMCLIRGESNFNSRLGASVPYSLGALDHRGRWGLQGSRPADAVVLWATLQVVGTDLLADTVDSSVRKTREFHEALKAATGFEPTHTPDLNLQTFRVGKPDPDGARLRRVQEILAERGRTWMSVSRWRDEALMRAVLLSPSLTSVHISGFVSDLEQAAR